MMVLIDTTVLSLVLRRRDPARLSAEDRRVVEAFIDLGRRGVAAMIGMVRQEVLSGVRSEDQFDRLRAALDGYAFVPVEVADHDLAARMTNACRARGIAMGDVDALLCAVAVRRQAECFSVDADFERYAAVLPVRLFTP